MADEQIRNYQGVVIGLIKHLENGDKAAMSFPSRTILGYYKPKYDYTTDFQGRVIGKGDSVVSLIYNPQYNKDLQKLTNVKI